MRTKPDIWDDVALALVGIPIAFSLQKLALFVLDSEAAFVWRVFLFGGAVAFYSLYYFSYTPALLSQLRLLLKEKRFPSHGVWTLVFLFSCLGGILMMGVMFDKTHHDPMAALMSALFATMGLAGANLHVSFVGESEKTNRFFDWLFVAATMTIVVVLSFMR